MADHRNVDAKNRPAVAMPLRTQAAQQVAVAVVRDIQNALDPEILSCLQAAVLDPASSVTQQVVKQLLSDGLRKEDLADFYVPAVSHALGERWCVDTLGFADVTIGVSRLQGVLRSLGPNWSGLVTSDGEAGSILLVVPDQVHHSLGAVVLAGQLRRKGISVKLVLGERPKDIADRVSRASYDAVFISSSQCESLETLRRIVDAVKTASSVSPFVVIGGSILETETSENVTALTKADYATRIPEEALRFCGLPVTTQDDAQTKIRT